MPGPLENKHIVLGVTGSIACYKALDLASKMMQAGAMVDTVMSYGATQFVTALAFRSITHREVVTDTFDPDSRYSVEHVALAKQADVIVIAPATAHCIAKLAAGLADDALTTTVIAASAPLLVAPAMDGNMFHHPATQENPGQAEGARRRYCRTSLGSFGLRLDRCGAFAGDAGIAGLHRLRYGQGRRPCRTHHRG